MEGEKEGKNDSEKPQEGEGAPPKEPEVIEEDNYDNISEDLLQEMQDLNNRSKGLQTKIANENDEVKYKFV